MGDKCMENMTIIYYTANFISDAFLANTMKYLKIAIGETPVISVSQKPMDFGTNICVGDIGRSHINIYRQALIGAKAAKTKYVAFVEDDILYSKEHFQYIPTDGFFAYDKNIWVFYTYLRIPVFTYKNRVNFNGLICERDLFIEAMEERFAAWPDESKIRISCWAEPGRYEKHIRVTVRKLETYNATVPSIAFYHPTALSYLHLGTRKAPGENPCDILPYWGKSEDIKKLYQ
jgi:hypothetical protein